MDKFIHQKETPEKRLEYLESMADGVEQKDYYRKLETHELADAKHEFTQNALAIDDLQEQKKDAIKLFKSQIDPLKIIHKELGAQIRNGFKLISGKLFRFVDMENKMTYFYSSTGELIETETRPANIAELSQTNIIQLQRLDGTNN